MPEGPSIVILKEAVALFKGKRIIAADGNTHKLDVDRLIGEQVTDFKSWGKHFLICFPSFALRVHFMLFGSYLINETKSTPTRLHLQFNDGEINFYSCSLQLIEKPLDEVYDWSVDVMSPVWNAEKALHKLQDKPEMLVCDAMLDQQIFSGSGNIIKNEVLFRIQVHPSSRLGNMPLEKLKEMIDQTVIYSFEFLYWKKEFTLKKHWLAHTKKICPRDHVPFHKEYLGKTNRRSYFCNVCQKLYL